MITEEEAQYYEYIGPLYAGHGEAIELGCWLGKSTKYIIRGLRKSPSFSNKTLHVFDDFVWRHGYMDKWTQDVRLPNHSDFRPIFEQFVQDILPDLTVTRARIVDFDGNEHLPRIEWDGRPIEIMYIDCGATIEVNERWFETFSSGFIPDLTLLIMQDWGTHRARPRLPFHQTLLFTMAHPEMELIHRCRTAASLRSFIAGNRHELMAQTGVTAASREELRQPRGNSEWAASRSTFSAPQLVRCFFLLEKIAIGWVSFAHRGPGGVVGWCPVGLRWEWARGRQAAAERSAGRAVQLEWAQQAAGAKAQ
jgi:hypothetical protein